MVDKQKIIDLVKTYFKCHVGHMRSVEPHVNDDHSVDVDGDVSMWKTPPHGQLPVKFNMVNGTFRAENKKLTSLHNAPNTCDRLYVGSNHLTSLAGCPPELDVLNVENNRLTSFEHGPQIANHIFAYGNPLDSLQGLPEQYLSEIQLTYSATLPLLRLLNAQVVLLGSPGGGYMRMKGFEPVNTIINKYAGEGKKGALACAVELVKAGYKEHARW